MLTTLSTKALSCILDNYGLTQHATGPAHNKGHTQFLRQARGPVLVSTYNRFNLHDTI